MTRRSSNSPRRLLRSRAIGLVLALTGPAAVSFGFRWTRAGSWHAEVVAPGLLCVLALGVLALVRIGERQPYSSIGIRVPTAATLVWAALMVGANVLMFAPVMEALLARIGSAGFAHNLARMRELSMMHRVALVVSVPLIEDFLYRGYAIERLSSLLNNRGGAVLLSSLAFAASHVPSWGLSIGLVLFLPAVCHAAFYAWRPELAVLVVSHVATDALGVFVWQPHS